MQKHVTVKIGGEAGFGIMSAGTMLTKAFVRHGYYAIAANEYPSLIRGGHNVITVGLKTTPFHALGAHTDILVALNKETATLHAHQLSPQGCVIYDPKDQTIEASTLDGRVAIAIPLTEIVQTFSGEPVMRNTVAIGAVTALLGADFSFISDIIADQFAKKGEDVIRENTALAKAGYDAVKKEYGHITGMHLDAPSEQKEQYVMNASEAVGLGALDGGMKFAAIYPMTPINALITLFADHAKAMGIVYKQPEDEIAGINMAIGASLAGVRSMVATSGGGFALMEEGVSLAGVVEIPVVIDLGMRPGPATGMPTWTEQGELGMVLHAGHGEFARVVLAPGDVGEAYTLTRRAFDLAEEYQIPVFILTDKYLNENQWCVDKAVFADPPKVTRLAMANPSNDDFKRYHLDTQNGVSPRSVPGMEFGRYIANSYEHDEQGFTTEASDMRTMMAGKRQKKIGALEAIAPAPAVYGPGESDITFVAWGSTKGPVLEAINLLSAEGKIAKLIHFSWIYPMNKEKVKEMLLKEKRLVLVEGNGTGQLGSFIRAQTGIEIKEKLLKYDGRGWYPEEIVQKITNHNGQNSTRNG